jgi:molecular chaperone GrpE
MRPKDHNSARERYRLQRISRGTHARLNHWRREETAPQPEPEIVYQMDPAAQQIAAENEQLRDALMRHKADFDNYRRRTLKEKEQIGDAAKEALVSTLLPVLDNLDLALQSARAAQDVDSVRKGIEMVVEELVRTLAAQGLERIDPLGQPFDPVIAEALCVEERTDVPDGQIVEALRPAYRFRDRVIRPALVKVAKRPAAEAANSE